MYVASLYETWEGARGGKILPPIPFPQLGLFKMLIEYKEKYLYIFCVKQYNNLYFDWTITKGM